MQTTCINPYNQKRQDSWPDDQLIPHAENQTQSFYWHQQVPPCCCVEQITACSKAISRNIHRHSNYTPTWICISETKRMRVHQIHVSVSSVTTVIHPLPEQLTATTLLGANDSNRPRALRATTLLGANDSNRPRALRATTLLVQMTVTDHVPYVPQPC
jgi:hypothetical protein